MMVYGSLRSLRRAHRRRTEPLCGGRAQERWPHLSGWINGPWGSSDFWAQENVPFVRCNMATISSYLRGPKCGDAPKLRIVEVQLDRLALLFHLVNTCSTDRSPILCWKLDSLHGGTSKMYEHVEHVSVEPKAPSISQHLVLGGELSRSRRCGPKVPRFETNPHLVLSCIRCLSPSLWGRPY